MRVRAIAVREGVSGEALRSFMPERGRAPWLLEDGTWGEGAPAAVPATEEGLSRAARALAAAPLPSVTATLSPGGRGRPGEASLRCMAEEDQYAAGEPLAEGTPEECAGRLPGLLLALSVMSE